MNDFFEFFYSDLTQKKNKQGPSVRVQSQFQFQVPVQPSSSRINVSKDVSIEPGMYLFSETSFAILHFAIK